MRRWMTVFAMTCLAAGLPALAQAAEDYEATVPSYGLGVALGIADTEGPAEPYYSVSFRIRLGDRGMTREELQRGGIQGYIEPEVAYWSHDSDNSDLLAGVNLIGLVPFRHVDYTFGVGAGVHFLDYQTAEEVRVSTNPTVFRTDITDNSDEHVGVNAQFGLDVRMTDNVALFGVGRYDLVEGSVYENQTKAYLGLRFSF